jgi:hypothetical protein
MERNTMSAVTVAVIVGFVCCAMVIRALGARQDERRQRVVVDTRGQRAAKSGAFYE